jgi:hypothetical protein
MKSNTAENARLQHEAGQTFFAFEEFSNGAADRITYTGTMAIFSQKSGFTPDIKPNGLDTGGVIVPEVGLTNNQVDVAACSVYLAGVQTAVSAAAGTSVTRATTASYFLTTSITVNAGGAIAAVAGTEGIAQVETRGIAGGPPLIAVDSVEIGQVRLEGNAAAPVVATDIFQVVNQHQERYDFPVWEEQSAEATIVFASALPAIHTGAVPKKVFAESYAPIFVDVPLASDFVPPAVTHSVGSTQVYQSTIGSVSKSLGAGGFTVYLKDGITDTIVKEADETIWFKFWPDKNKAPYILANGTLGMSTTFPAGDSIQSACTISASEEATGKAS